MKDYEKQKRTYEEKLRAEAKEEPAYKLLQEAFNSGCLVNTSRNNTMCERVKRYLETGFLTRRP